MSPDHKRLKSAMSSERLPRLGAGDNLGRLLGWGAESGIL